MHMYARGNTVRMRARTIISRISCTYICICRVCYIFNVHRRDVHIRVYAYTVCMHAHVWSGPMYLKYTYIYLHIFLGCKHGAASGVYMQPTCAVMTQVRIVCTHEHAGAGATRCSPSEFHRRISAYNCIFRALRAPRPENRVNPAWQFQFAICSMLSLIDEP